MACGGGTQLLDTQKSLFIDPITDRQKLILPKSEIRSTASHLNYVDLSQASYIDGDPPWTSISACLPQ